MVGTSVYSFHNSAYLRSPFVQRGETRHWKNYNNAIEYTFEPPHGSPNTGHFSQTRTLSKKDQHKRLYWHETYDDRGDVCNHPDFPDGFDPAWGYDIKDAHQSENVLKRSGTKEKLELADRNAQWAKAIEFELEYADGEKHVLSKSAQVGCRQSDGTRYDELKYKRIGLDILNRHLRAQLPHSYPSANSTARRENGWLCDAGEV